jgi:hypothetical protein
MRRQLAGGLDPGMPLVGELFLTRDRATNSAIALGGESEHLRWPEMANAGVRARAGLRAGFV